MQARSRYLTIDICDYTKKVLCNIYDNKADVSGQAHDVFINYERNGWKELSFQVPSVCEGPDGQEPNYRLDFLVADYKLRVVTDDETDWYLISEPKIHHDNFSKNVTVTANHIASLLKTKNLDLEFSDDEGNNVGTAEQFAEVILEGTGWTLGEVATFYEDDGVTEKIRSLTTSVGTGVFKMMQDMCSLFDAKCIYHGEEKTVDILPLNPFAETTEGQIPREVLDGHNVLEIHYGQNSGSIERTQNTDNIVTKLLAYGSYGDENGLCGITTCSHDEYTFSISDQQEEYCFEDKDELKYYFAPEENLTGKTVIWSSLDFLSRSYVWCVEDEKAYPVYRKAKTASYNNPLTAEPETVRNYFPYLFNFTYYQKVGLFTDEMLQEAAKYQREIPDKYRISEEASAQMIEDAQELSETAESNTGFLRLDVSSYSNDNNCLKLNINKLVYPDGVMYRSDYDSQVRRYFEWHVAKQLRPNGDPVSGSPSMVIIVHDTDPVTYDMAYLQKIDGIAEDYDYKLSNREPPSDVTLWINPNDVPPLDPTDRFYLFCTKSLSGSLGEKIAEMESIETTVEQKVKEGGIEDSVIHPVYFIDKRKGLPPTPSVYGWCYLYEPFELTEGEYYFCRDNAWKRVYMAEEAPEVVNGAYFYNLKYKTLWHGENGSWMIMDTIDDEQLARNFGVVYYFGQRRDQINKGLYKEYTYETSVALPAGSYAFRSEYGYFFWAFTTDREIEANSTITLDSVVMSLNDTDDPSKIFKASVLPYENLGFPASNCLEDVSFIHKTIDPDTGVERDSDTMYASYNVYMYEDMLYDYSMPANSYVVFYDKNRKKISTYPMTSSVAPTGSFTTPHNTYYGRFVSATEPTSQYYVRVRNYDKKFYTNRRMYNILGDLTPVGEPMGINTLMKKMADLADVVYMEDLETMIAAQNVIKEKTNDLADTLGELYREQRWQDSNYVEGDESRLYTDAMDNLKEIGQPDTTYNISFLDRFDSNRDMEYALSEESENAVWPDLKVTDAVHLVDPELDLNLWAYIDKLNKCFDKPWETSLEINTKLSLIGQHDFTDVMTRIAEVASETKAKQTIYGRAAVIGSMGQITSDRLEGTIAANKTLFKGGASSWYTDEDGAIIFESSDGLNAMKLAGYGFCLANSKDEYGDWNWRSWGTGAGFSADEIVTGFLSANVIEAGTITADKVSSNFGQELDIGSNSAIVAFATVDGVRPAGALRTTDGYIEITAGKAASGQQPAVPAKIDIKSGGSLNLYGGGSVNITTSDHGKFHVDSPNFKVYEQNSVDKVWVNGEIIAKAGQIADFVIGRRQTEIDDPQTEEDESEFVHYLYYNTDSTQSTTNGVYLGSDGVNFGGKLKYIFNNQTASLDLYADLVNIGDNNSYIRLDGYNSTMSLNAADISIEGDSTITIAAGETLNLLSGGDVIIGTTGQNLQSPFHVGANNLVAYIYSGKTTISDTTNGIYIGTDGINIGYSAGSYFKALPNGNVEMSGTIHAAGGDIGGWHIDNNKLYHYQMMDDPDNPGTDIVNPATYIAMGTDPLSNYRIWAGAVQGADAPFSVKKDGSISASSGTVGGWTLGVSSLTGDKVGLAVVDTDSEYVIWAGNNTASSATFSVTKGGALYATSATIKGAINSGSTITGATISGGSLSIGSKFSVNSSGVMTATSASFTGSINSGSTISGASISSGSITIGSNFSVNSSGVMTAKSASFTGSISGTSISGGTISGASISGGSLSIGSSFSVNSSGVLSASSASISGTLTAGQNSKIGNWTVTSDGFLQSKSSSTTLQDIITLNPNERSNQGSTHISNMAIICGATTTTNSYFWLSKVRCGLIKLVLRTMALQCTEVLTLVLPDI